VPDQSCSATVIPISSATSESFREGETCSFLDCLKAELGADQRMLDEETTCQVPDEMPRQPFVKAALGLRNPLA